MEPELRKKKKAQNYKVTLLADKIEQSAQCHKVSGTDNAYFPYEPYPEQAMLISKLHETIKNGKNGLVESPTGTGKTLCMLVASLSACCSLSSPAPGSSHVQKSPKIFYLTRTHSQITQVINELKQLPWYKCRVNIIASREHLCINRNLKQLKGRLLDRGCQQMCKQKLCKFKEGDIQDGACKDGKDLKEWLTLQELRDKGNKKGFCPFYLSKAATQKCQLTIMPFNYLLDWSLFQMNNFNLKNSIIIFDQAHNVDSLAEQGSSLEIDSDMITQSLLQIKNLEQSSKCRYLHKKFQLQNNVTDNDSLNFIKLFLSRLVTCLKQLGQYEKNYTCLQDMLQLMRKVTNFANVHQGKQYKGVDLNNFEDLITVFEKVKKMFQASKIQGQQFEIFYRTFMKIMKILDSDSNNMQDYYMFIGPKSLKSWSIKLNCLNASFTFHRLSQQHPRSIILCSGTLGSFALWQNQLNIPFKTQLKIPSFITRHQIYTSIIQHSSTNPRIKYQFSYQNKNNQQQYQQLGKQLRKIGEIVPNGIVVAFSTYQIMQNCIRYCIDMRKPVFYQAKNQNIQRIFQKYQKQARSDKGAYLFIVMKGKFSQGINFSDQLCRCLIVIGIPFLPPNDYKIQRKKAYLSNKFSKECAEQWYYTQTFKTVNQVIGRAIRSKNDYGVVLLIDQRYNRKDVRSEISGWVTDNLGDERKIGYVQGVKGFFRERKWECKEGQNNNNKHDMESSFQLALSKTILAANNSKSHNLQTLLNQQTPVKINRPPHRVLKIVQSDDDSQTAQMKNIKNVKVVKNRSKSNKRNKEKSNNKNKKYKAKEPVSNVKLDLDLPTNSQEQQKTSPRNYNETKNQQISTEKPIKKPLFQSPWFSIDYFIGDQIKQYVKQSKERLSNRKKEQTKNMLKIQDRDVQQSKQEECKQDKHQNINSTSVIVFKNKKKPMTYL